MPLKASLEPPFGIERKSMKVAYLRCPFIQMEIFLLLQVRMDVF